MENREEITGTSAWSPLELGTWIGKSQAFGAIAKSCTGAEAACLKQIRDQRSYESLGLTWEQFCPRTSASAASVPTGSSDGWRNSANRIFNWPASPESPPSRSGLSPPRSPRRVSRSTAQSSRLRRKMPTGSAPPCRRSARAYKGPRKPHRRPRSVCSWHGWMPGMRKCPAWRSVPFSMRETRPRSKVWSNIAWTSCGALPHHLILHASALPDGHRPSGHHLRGGVGRQFPVFVKPAFGHDRSQ